MFLGDLSTGNDKNRVNTHNVEVTSEKTRAATWLEEHYIAWRNKQKGRRAPVQAFASAVGITRDDFYNVMRGDGLGSIKVARIAEALGDDMAFEVFGVGRPDPIRWAFEKVLEALSPEAREEWLKEGEKLVEKGKRGAARKAKTAENS